MEVLLITRDDLVRFTALGGSVDTDKFIQFIKIAQDTHIQGYLGTKLLKKYQQIIMDDEIDDLVNADYKSLLLTYIKPMMIHWAMVEYLPFMAYSFSNKGMYKHSAENAENVEKSEVDYLVEKERDIAQSYTQRFLDHIGTYSYLYPEYLSNDSGDMHPNKNNFFKGWYI
jgi:hypothetical protein